MRIELDGVVSYTGDLASNKAERIADIIALGKQTGEEAFSSVDVERAALKAGGTGAHRQNVRSTYGAVFDRTVSLAQEVNDCTTLEQVWNINVQFDNLELEYVPETNFAHLSGAPNTLLSNVETRIGTAITIRPSHVNAKIKLEARVDLGKDLGVTIREATIAIRRGDSNVADMVGQRCIVRSQNLASTAYGPAVIFEVDSPNTTDEVTYTLRGLVGLGNSTVERATLTATEL